MPPRRMLIAVAGALGALAQTGSALAPPAPGLEVLRVRLGGPPSDLAAGAGALWAPIGGRVLRLDRRGRAVASIRLRASEASGVAVGAGSVWVTSGDAGPPGVVSRIDPVHDRVAAVIRTGGSPTRIVAGAEGVWVWRAGRQTTLLRIDPQSDRVTARVRLGASSYGGLALRAGVLWALDGEGARRLDARTGRPLGRLSLRPPPQSLGSGPRRVWLGLPAGRVLGIGAPGRPAIALAVRLAGGVGPLAASGRGLWVASACGCPGALVERLSLGAGRVTARIPVGATPTAVAIWQGAVWVASFAAERLTRIAPVDGPA